MHDSLLCAASEPHTRPLQTLHVQGRTGTTPRSATTLTAARERHPPSPPSLALPFPRAPNTPNAKRIGPRPPFRQGQKFQNARDGAHGVAGRHLVAHPRALKSATQALGAAAVDEKDASGARTPCHEASPAPPQFALRNERKSVQSRDAAAMLRCIDTRWASRGRRAPPTRRAERRASKPLARVGHADLPALSRLAGPVERAFGPGRSHGARWGFPLTRAAHQPGQKERRWPPIRGEKVTDPNDAYADQAAVPPDLAPKARLPSPLCLSLSFQLPISTTAGPPVVALCAAAHTGSLAGSCATRPNQDDGSSSGRPPAT